MNRVDGVGSRLALLLGFAPAHLETCIRERFDDPNDSDPAGYEATVRPICDQIERFRFAVEHGAVDQKLVWEMFGVFDRAMDWDHLASDYKLGDEIRDLIYQLYSHHFKSTS